MKPRIDPIERLSMSVRLLFAGAPLKLRFSNLSKKSASPSFFSFWGPSTSSSLSSFCCLSSCCFGASVPLFSMSDHDTLLRGDFFPSLSDKDALLGGSVSSLSEREALLFVFWIFGSSLSERDALLLDLVGVVSCRSLDFFFDFLEDLVVLNSGVSAMLITASPQLDRRLGDACRDRFGDACCDLFGDPCCERFGDVC